MRRLARSHSTVAIAAIATILVGVTVAWRVHPVLAEQQVSLPVSSGETVYADVYNAGDRAVVLIAHGGTVHPLKPRTAFAPTRSGRS